MNSAPCLDCKGQIWIHQEMTNFSRGSKVWEEVSVAAYLLEYGMIGGKRTGLGFGSWYHQIPSNLTLMTGVDCHDWHVPPEFLFYLSLGRPPRESNEGITRICESRCCLGSGRHPSLTANGRKTVMRDHLTQTVYHCIFQITTGRGN